MVIDTNALVLLIVGLIDKNLISRHKRTSGFDKKDFDNLRLIARKPSDIIVPNNVWTEVDNLLNGFRGIHKSEYYLLLKKLIQETTEEYIASVDLVNKDSFQTVGITDSILLELSLATQHLITSDYELTNIARSKRVKVYNLHEQKIARKMKNK
jgi:rRNA maturation endonuclease Nob1